MTWKDRIFSEIKFTSPAGTVYTAKWRGGSRNTEKSLGIFKAPGIQGSIVQDLDIAAISYELTVFFDGPDHDLIADRFFQECGATRGIWEVIHPVKGRLNLQLVSYTELVDPVENGNITTFSTDWIEPKISAVTSSSEGARAQTAETIDSLNETSSFQFVKEIVLVSFENSAQVINATTRALDVYNQTLRTLIDKSVDVKNQIDTIQTQIISTVNAPIINTEILTGQIINMVQIPVQASEDIQESIALYYNFIDQLLSVNSGLKVDPNVLDNASINEILVNEIYVVSSLGAISDIIVNGELATRKQTVDLMNESNDRFIRIVDNLDEYQERFAGEYFSQSESYNSNVEMLSQTHRYLIISAFDLKIEKRITLDRPKTPAFITIEQYGSLGKNDENLDFLIESNVLKANDILLLQPGKEVLIYI
jgi:hypothetical protein